jgi:hypothetical protein
MYLARRYGLEWFLLLLILPAVLFIWKNATSFVPPEKETLAGLQSGKESMAALTNLLRRNVPETQLLSVSLSEWKKSAKGVAAERIQEVETIVAAEVAKPARHRNISAAYNAISNVLKQRR